VTRPTVDSQLTLRFTTYDVALLVRGGPVFKQRDKWSGYSSDKWIYRRFSRWPTVCVNFSTSDQSVDLLPKQIQSAQYRLEECRR
jgi:hypothetical protein